MEFTIFDLITLGLCGCFLALELTLMIRGPKRAALSSRCNVAILVAFLSYIALVPLLVFSGTGRVEGAGVGFQAAGTALLGLGLGVRLHAVITLNHAFSLNVTPKQGAVLVEKGLFRLIRHPSYLGAILGPVGAGLAFSNWILPAAALAVLVPLYIRRVAIEEAELVRVYGDGYLSYRGRTKKFVPFVF